MLFASPVRKTSEARGRLIVAAPEEQLSDPLAGPETRLMTHVLVGVLFAFGTESGAPKKQPTSEHVSTLPVVAAFVEPRTALWPVQESRWTVWTPRSGIVAGSGTEFCPPPK
jgi:hypothetical protein